MIRNIARRLAYQFAPTLTSDLQRFLYLRREAREIGRKDHASSLAEVFERLNRGPFPLQQIESEFLGLLDLIQARQPRRVLEIGAFRGGTLSMFCQALPPATRILSIDTAFRFPHRWAYRHFAQPGQRVRCLTADSHQPQTLEQVRGWLDGEPLDLLFIDGDHSFQGVAADFEMYSPLVRSGGTIAFHDIVPDFRTRYGKDTGNDVGEVPRFWAQLKQSPYRVREFINDPQQDGFGIGVIDWDGAPASAAIQK